MRPGDVLPLRWGDIPRAPHHAKLDALKRIHAAQATRQHAYQIAQLLQLWVSELEPQICVDQSGELLGLGYADQIIIPVRWLRHLPLTPF